MTTKELEEIAKEDNYSWIKINKQPDYDDNATGGENYDILEMHHIKETEFLIAKCQELAKELLRIKNGIKQCDRSLMIDGNDMTDYGWMTISDANHICHERWDRGISQYEKGDKDAHPEFREKRLKYIESLKKK